MAGVGGWGNVILPQKTEMDGVNGSRSFVQDLKRQFRRVRQKRWQVFIQKPKQKQEIIVNYVEKVHSTATTLKVCIP